MDNKGHDLKDNLTGNAICLGRLGLSLACSLVYSAAHALAHLPLGDWLGPWFVWAVSWLVG